MLPYKGNMQAPRGAGSLPHLACINVNIMLVILCCCYQEVTVQGSGQKITQDSQSYFL